MEDKLNKEIGEMRELYRFKLFIMILDDVCTEYKENKYKFEKDTINNDDNKKKIIDNIDNIHTFFPLNNVKTYKKNNVNIVGRTLRHMSKFLKDKIKLSKKNIPVKKEDGLYTTKTIYKIIVK